MKTTTALAVATVLAALTTAGCTATADKSGGEREPTTIVLASNDGNGAAGGLARFVELVDELSDGRLEVELSEDWSAKGEQQVLRDVAGGKAALGWSGTRAFDLIGVDSFQPLHAPFLVGSYPAQRAVVGDDVSREMLAGLEGSALTGLALLADELRFPAGAEQPLLEVRDFRGLPFGVMESRVQDAAMTTLGARVTGLSMPHPSAIEGLEGLETMWRTYADNDLQMSVPFVTANATLWPRTTVLVANTKSLAAMSDDDRDILTQAASEAALWSLDHADDDVADETARACARGARIALASTRQLRALRQESRPVYAALRSNPEQAALLERIEELVNSAENAEPFDVPDGCAYRTGDEDKIAVRVLPAPLNGPGESGALPAGSYRYTLTEDEIREGAPGAGAEFAAGNTGVWTWTLENGRWRYDVELTAAEVPDGYDDITYCEGYYDVHGNRVDFTTVTEYSPGWDCASKTWKADWRRTDAGLQMDVTTDADDLDFLFGAKPWERID